MTGAVIETTVRAGKQLLRIGRIDGDGRLGLVIDRPGDVDVRANGQWAGDEGLAKSDRACEDRRISGESRSSFHFKEGFSVLQRNRNAAVFREKSSLRM